MTHLAFGVTTKQRRVGGNGAARLLNVVTVVQADADDLPRVGNGRQQLHVFQREVGRLALRNGVQVGKSVRTQSAQQIEVGAMPRH